jgi:hypothetical protein
VSQKSFNGIKISASIEEVGGKGEVDPKSRTIFS